MAPRLMAAMLALSTSPILKLFGFYGIIKIWLI